MQTKTPEQCASSWNLADGTREKPQPFGDPRHRLFQSRWTNQHPMMDVDSLLGCREFDLIRGPRGRMYDAAGLLVVLAT